MDRDVDVSVFEATIRVLGGLVTSHALAEEAEAERNGFKGKVGFTFLA